MQPDDDAVHVRQLAEHLRSRRQPMCPQFRPVTQTEWTYPVEGYCVLAEYPGKLMIPSIEEHRKHCTTPEYEQCPWYRAGRSEVRLRAA